MAHIEQRNFCLKVKNIHPKYFINSNVLDVGSYDINGSNGYLFHNCVYFGIDIAPGRNVNAVSKGHEWQAPDNSYDVIISTECFEHDMYYPLTLQNIVRMLKHNGLFLFTCASTGRAEHGTKKCHGFTSPTSTIEENGWSDYYKNLTSKDIREAIDVDSIFKEYLFETNNRSCDLYFFGIKN